MGTEANEPSPWKNPQLLHMASLSFPGAIPLAVVLTTLPAWLADHDIKASDIGLIGLAGLPWSFKFLWAPLIDRYRPPFGGRRRGWVMLMQVALFVAIGAVGFLDPKSTTIVLGVGFMIAAFSATQDIAMDAYAVEFMKKSEHGPGNSLRTTFYRAGMMLSGGLAVASADAFDWSIVFIGIGAMMLLGVLLTSTAKEPEGDIPSPKTFAEAVTAPVTAFFRRDGVLAVAAFVLLYKLGDNMALSMTAPLIIQKLGVSKLEYGSIQKILGTSATISGVLIGGALIAKLGLGRCLWLFGFMQASVNGLFALTAYTDGYRPSMYAAIGLEAAMAGMGTAALLSLMMRITEKRYAATQFALLSSLMGLGRTLASPPSGFIVEAIGYGPFFLCTIAAGLPGLFFLSRFVPFGAKEPVLVDPNTP